MERKGPVREKKSHSRERGKATDWSPVEENLGEKKSSAGILPEGET